MFKKCLLLLLGGVSMSLRAQKTDVIPDYRSAADQVLKGISQYPVPSGILYSRIFPFSACGTDIGQNKILKTNEEQVIQLVHELKSASISPPENIPGPAFFRAYRGKAMSGNLHLLALNTLVEEIDTGRIRDSSLVLKNGFFQFYPRPGKENPFVQSEKTTAALMTGNTVSTEKNYRIFYPENLPCGKLARNLISAKIKIGESEWMTLQPDLPLQFKFSRAGKWTVQMELKWSNQVSRIYEQELEVQTEDACNNNELFLRPDDCPEWTMEPEYQPSFPSMPIQADIPFENITGKGEVLFYMSPGNHAGQSNPTFRNPIIFVDGIDFGDSRKGQAIYGKYLSYLPEPGAPGSVRFGQQLRSLGHDLIILNFPDGHIPEMVEEGKANPDIDGGSDYIERNAMVLVKLIQYINERLETGSNKITVAGPSMGGLIARYALAYMEKNQNQTGHHKCGLYISQDAPHLGANIPVGLQQLLRNLAGFNLTQAEYAWESMNSPAACELLLNHALHGENSSQHELRGSFLQNLQSNSLSENPGWPSDPDLRMISISNGASTGLPINALDNPPGPVTGGNEMLSFNIRIANLGILAIAMAVFDNGFSLGPALFLLSGKMEWKSRYVPGQNGTAETFGFNFGLSLLEEDMDIYNEQCNWKAFDGGISLDASPGGKSNTTAIFSQSLREGFGLAGNLLRVNFEKADHFHSFIPCKSALAFRWNSGGLKFMEEDLSQRNLVCTGETPFHAYFCPEGNEDHVRLTAESATFIYNQLNYVPPQGGTSYPAEIIGPRAVPAGSSVEFNAAYQGNLEFRTSWSISEQIGISATVLNPFSRSCRVNSSSGTGQDYGHFILNLTTEVKSLNGEWICAGKKAIKVNVRKIKFMGNIEVACETDLPKGCYFKLYSGTPDYSQLTNGVSGNGYEWQVSRYADSEFGSSCWDGSLVVIASGTGPNNMQRAYINLLHNTPYGMGNQFTYFVRVRNKMLIPNPDLGNPGEPAFLDMYGTWKIRQLGTEILPGPNCPSCPGTLIVNPENPIAGDDKELELRLPEEFPLPADVSIIDENMVRKAIRIHSNPTAISLEELKSGRFSIEVVSGVEKLKGTFWLRAAAMDGLMASPRIISDATENNLFIKIVDDHYLEEGNGSYEATLENPESGIIRKWTGNLQQFQIEPSELPPGRYLTTLHNGIRHISCNFEILPTDEEEILLIPNPAVTEIQVGIPDAEISEDARISIRDAFGNEERSVRWSADVQRISIGNLKPGIHLLQIQNKEKLHSRWFRKE